MNAEEFTKQLDAIVEEAREKAIALVNKAQEDEGLTWDTQEPVSFCDSPNWEHKADSLAELSGWIYDRLNGYTRMDKKSVTKKIRKALGYTYP